jgi:hypothetical protein
MSLASGVFPVGTPNNAVTGSITNVNDAVTIVTDGLGSVDFAMSGSPVGATAVFEATSDGTTWIGIKAYPKGSSGLAGVTSATAAGIFNVTTGGYKSVRVRMSATTSGTFTVVANGTVDAAHIGVKNSNATDLNATVTISSTDAQVGVDGTGITAPTGGSGIRGWLSGIYKALTGTLSVTAVSTGGVVVSPVQQVITVGSSSVASATVNSLTTRVILTSTTDCWVSFGATPTAAVATTGNIFVPAGVPSYPISVTGGTTKIAVIENAAAGYLSIMEAE